MDELVERVLPVGAGLAPDDRPRRVVRRSRRPGGRRACRCSPCRLAGNTRRSGACTGRTAGWRASAAPKKFEYQMPSMARMTGAFFSSGAVRKCSSIAWPPASISSKLSIPIDQRDGEPDRAPERVAPADPVPELEHVLGSMPNFFDLLGRGRDRDEVLRDRRLVARAASTSHARAVRAFISVSCVVNVLDATMKSVLSGSRLASVSARCVPSTFETKCARSPACQYGLSASLAITGPRSEPPMPMLTTSVMRLPV